MGINMVVKNIFVARGICKSYQGRTIIDNINIKITSGEIRGILGPNGAGKTTTFHALAGLTTCDKGSIFLNNIEVTDLKLPKRAKMGIAYLPQDSSIFRGLSVSDNIYSVLELIPDITQEEKLARLENILTRFQLHRIRNISGNFVSGGERRRVEVARALALSPKIILLDEPFAGIDPVSVTEIKQIIMQIKEDNIGVVITDHNVRETLKICDQADIMHQGQLIKSGSSASILNDNKVREIYLGQEFDIN